MRNYKIILLLLIPFIGCIKQKDPPPNANNSMYFPSNTNKDWETKSIASLKWNQNAVQLLKEYLIQKNTKSFIILVNGRIVMEEYFNGHTQDSAWE